MAKRAIYGRTLVCGSFILNNMQIFGQYNINQYNLQNTVKAIFQEQNEWGEMIIRMTRGFWERDISRLKRVSVKPEIQK